MRPYQLLLTTPNSVQRYVSRLIVRHRTLLQVKLTNRRQRRRHNANLNRHQNTTRQLLKVTLTRRHRLLIRHTTQLRRRIIRSTLNIRRQVLNDHKQRSRNILHISRYQHIHHSLPKLRPPILNHHLHHRTGHFVNNTRSFCINSKTVIVGIRASTHVPRRVSRFHQVHKFKRVNHIFK